MKININTDKRTYSVTPNLYFDNVEVARFVATTLIEIATYIVEDMNELQEES